jgi:hypothetical protein
MPTFRVLVVDDYEPFRRVVRSILQQRDDLQIIGEASDGLEAVQKAKELRPDLILLDIALPTLNGIQAARRLRDLVPRAKIMFVSVEFDQDVVREAFSAGGLAYINKLHIQTELLPGIETVLRGDQFVGSALDHEFPHHRFTCFGREPATRSRWALKGNGYEFCNCDFACGCSLGGSPTSKDGSCRALLGMHIDSGFCGDVNLSDVKCATIVHWPTGLHGECGECVLVVEPTISTNQIEAIRDIVGGKLGGMPWELFGSTFEVKGFVRAVISIEGSGSKSVFKVEGVGEAYGDTFKDPVTGKDYCVHLESPDGFIWKKGLGGQGTFSAQAAGVAVEAERSNWVLYNFHWTNE